MSLLAHAVIGTTGLEPQKRDLDDLIKQETMLAKRVQKDTPCTWSEAIAIARNIIADKKVTA